MGETFNLITYLRQEYRVFLSSGIYL